MMKKKMYINLDGLEEGLYTAIQNRGQQTFFYKAPDSKYFWLCGSCSLCCVVINWLLRGKSSHCLSFNKTLFTKEVVVQIWPVCHSLPTPAPESDMLPFLGS